MVEQSNRETVESDDERASTRRTDESGVTRRRTLQLGGLVGVGSIFGAVGFGADGVAAAEGSRPDDIIHLDYDDYDSWSDIYRLSNGDSADLNFVSSPTYTGENAIQLQVNENDHWGANAHYDFEDGLFELNNRMRFALNTNWSMEGRSLSNCRIWNCALSIGEASAGGTVPDGTNGWSNRMYVSSRGTDPDGPFHLLSDTYHIDAAQDHNYIMDDDEYALAQPEIEPGVWYDFESYVCVNTISNGEPNDDGIVRYWLDDELIFERENFSFTSDLGDNIIDTTGPVGHYGGRYEAPKDLFTYYDTHSMALNGVFEFDSCGDGDRTFDESDEQSETDGDSNDEESTSGDAEEIEDELEEIEDTLEESGVEFPQGLGELFSM
ncbi:hypothetical protein [Halostagnicola sp. A-GB9-2]|uniref:hypothetical protein n=1 Tax=Halostagnicola sp. A-GB9-2 TaxID=3048066 RepID=UPI0031F2DB86